MRFSGQGMMSHTATTTISRYFTKSRGKALSTSWFGLSTAEFILPVLMIYLLAITNWKNIWITISSRKKRACWSKYFKAVLFIVNGFRWIVEFRPILLAKADVVIYDDVGAYYIRQCIPSTIHIYVFKVRHRIIFLDPKLVPYIIYGVWQRSWKTNTYWSRA